MIAQFSDQERWPQPAPLTAIGVNERTVENYQATTSSYLYDLSDLPRSIPLEAKDDVAPWAPPETSSLIDTRDTLSSLLKNLGSAFLRLDESSHPSVAEWISTNLQKGRLSYDYLLYILKELQHRFRGAHILLTLREEDYYAPLKILIYGVGDPEEESDILWAFEAELNKQGRFPLDFGISIIDL